MYYHPTFQQYYDPRYYQIYNTENQQFGKYYYDQTEFHSTQLPQLGSIENEEIGNDNREDRLTGNINHENLEIEEVDDVNENSQMEDVTLVANVENETSEERSEKTYSELIYQELRAIRRLLEKN